MQRGVLRHSVWLYLLLLLWAGLRYTAQVDQVLDIGFSDETRYLSHGLRLTFADLHTVRAPLYAVWYKGLAQVADDPLTLYDLNLRAQMVLLPVALFGALVAADVPPWGAFALGWAWLLGDANLEPWPRVSAFAWLVVLEGLAAFAYLKQGRRGWLVLLGSVLLSMYARPEMGLALAVLLGLAWRRVQPGERKGMWGGLLLLALAGVALFGSPFEPGRFLAAFGQHFAFRWRAEYLPNGSPWSDWGQALANAFGPDTHTFFDLLRANPQAIAAHVAANVGDIPRRWGKLLLSHTPWLFPDHPKWGALLWGFVGLAGLIRWLQRDKRVWWARYGEVSVAAVALALPALLGAVVIYPRYHYLLGLTVMAWYLWGMMALGRTAPAPRPWAWGPVVAVVLTLTTPPITAHFGYRPPLEVRVTLLTLRQLEQAGAEVAAVPAGWNEGNADVYLPEMTLRRPETWTFQAVVALGADVAVIPNGRQRLNAPDFQAELRQWQAQGWRAFCTPRRQYLILTRILPRAPLPVQPCAGD